MFEKLKTKLTSLFFPYDEFTQKVLTIINHPQGLTLGDVYSRFGEDPSIGRLSFTLNRLKEHGYAKVENLALSHPPKMKYTITEKGLNLLEKTL